LEESHSKCHKIAYIHTLICDRTSTDFCINVHYIATGKHKQNTSGSPTLSERD